MSRPDHVLGGMTESSETELHALIVARDEGAFAEWERRTAPRVLRMLIARGASVEDAEEIWNETLSITWARAVAPLPLEPAGEGLRRYAFGAARRVLAGRIRSGSREVQTVALDERDQLGTPDFRTAASRQPSKRVYALRRCMEMIEERWRVILEMVMIHADAAEIADAVGIAQSSVRKYVQRAKSVIRACIEGETDV